MISACATGAQHRASAAPGIQSAAEAGGCRLPADLRCGLGDREQGYAMPPPVLNPI
jgi:hypothetical protein